MQNRVPYFSQWESREWVAQFVAKTRAAEDDPLWARSGAKSPEEYASWSPHICGMACLKMILAHRRGRHFPLMTLVEEAIRYDVYQPEKGDEGKRLFYRPFVRMLQSRFHIDAHVVEHVAIAEATAMVQQGCLFMASVHPAIRSPEVTPPSKGGHLILVFAVQGTHNDWVFHNPSGFTVETQQNVCLSRAVVDRFYAGRGIVICPPAGGEAQA